MASNLLLSRRTLFTATATAAFAGASALETRAVAAPKAHQLKIGVASYSLRKLPLDKAIDACKEADVRFIALKAMHLPFDASAADLAAARAKIEAAGIAIMGGGVITMKKDEAAIRKYFEYARTARLPLIIASPDPDAVDLVESMVKEFNIPVAIHNHGPEDKHYPAPADVMTMIKKRDKRIGVCIDIGHTVRAGADPIKSVKECGDRLFDMHIKDLRDKTNKDSQVEVGKGAIDIAGLFKVLHKRRFAGHVALEYEINELNPLPGIKESLAYMRGVAAGLSA